ncbi:hypothetical protein PG994_010529 [Apiospora phragmitis]|uniref:Uncharacterized protein n=1 Tax=Apiospora phragmitis TaxID=2905665 RepID=A0ABR1TST1_9PEZI
MASPNKASSSAGGVAALRYPLGGLPPVKLDPLTKWEHMQIRKIRKQRRGHRRRGLDRKLAHINFTINMQDSGSDDSVSDECDGEHMPYDSSDECDGVDPDCCYQAFAGDIDD